MGDPIEALWRLLVADLHRSKGCRMHGSFVKQALGKAQRRSDHSSDEETSGTGALDWDGTRWERFQQSNATAASAPRRLAY